METTATVAAIFFLHVFSIMLGADVGHMQTFGAYISKTLDPAVNAVCH